MDFKNLLKKKKQLRLTVDDLKDINHIRLYYIALEKFQRSGDILTTRIGQTFGISSPFKIPEGMSMEHLDYHYASELTAEIRNFGGFCIGGACYPEGHPESRNSAEDIESLRIKVECGCEFLTTQMFFDNNILYNFMYRLLRAGVDVPVVAGIMPVTNANQIKRICAISGNALPQRFLRIVDRYGDNAEAMKQAGIAYATDQIIDLFANGVNAVHVYSMNKPDVARQIKNNISEIIK